MPISRIAGIQLLVGAALLPLAALPNPAAALPSCPVPSPTSISDPKQEVDQLWQRYRKLTPEGRCCSKPCEPIIKLSAKVEKSALELHRIATDPHVPKNVRDKAHNDANAMFAQRSDLDYEFTRCLIDTRVRFGPSGKYCNGPSISKVDLGWMRWCGTFADRISAFRNLLLASVATKAGTWQVQTNQFRIMPDGEVDQGSLSILGHPATQLPPGVSKQPFFNKANQAFGPYPAGATQRRMYMQLTARAYRAVGPNAKPIDTTPILQGACPGLTNR